jgi:hypothetical protein
LIGQVAGTESDLTRRITGTFSALAKLGDFDSETLDTSDGVKKPSTQENDDSSANSNKAKPLRTEFHYNIQVHLPSNGTEEVYLNIFSALHKTFR